MIIIDFQRTQGRDTFSDAIALPDDHTFTEEEIEAMKQERFNNWLAIMYPDPAVYIEI
jgi:hypothetical protein